MLSDGSFGIDSFEVIHSFNSKLKEIRDSCTEWSELCKKCLEICPKAPSISKWQDYYLLVPGTANCGPRGRCTLCGTCEWTNCYRGICPEGLQAMKKFYEDSKNVSSEH
jgi:ferredoxin